MNPPIGAVVRIGNEDDRARWLAEAAPDLLRACENALRDWPIEFSHGIPMLTETDKARVAELRRAIHMARHGGDA